MSYRNTKEKRITYMLHYTNEAGEVQHYCGNTTYTRLLERLKEHRTGRDTPRTHQLRQRGFRIAHVTIMPMHDERYERLMCCEPAASLACPVCSENSPFAKCERIEGDRHPEQKRYSRRRPDDAAMPAPRGRHYPNGTAPPLKPPKSLWRKQQEHIERRAQLKQEEQI